MEPGDPFHLGVIGFLTNLREVEPRRLPFGEVPPLLFSEGLRDIHQVLEDTASET